VTGAPEPAFQPDSRERNLDGLREAPLDVLIIGGGINGAGIARDLALRAQTAQLPLRIGLVEKRHFASGTSGRNSQLIHGGLRYLKYFEFGLVREALRERATLLRMAPHLVEPLPLILPFYNWFDRRFYGTGLWLYDLLAGSANIARRRYLDRQAAMNIEPGLAAEGLHSAAIFYDCRVNAARGVLENVFDAARAGVIVANYAEASEPRRRGDRFEIDIHDRLGGSTFPIETRRVADARGPWAGNSRLVRGSHIIVPRLNASDDAIAYFGGDGRIIFVIPWGEEHRLSLVGTTDVDHTGSADEVGISADEVRYLLAIVRRLFPASGDVTPIAAYSSLRPLAAAESGSATAATREHRIWIEDGIVRIVGGKYTTYRSMSEEAVDVLAGEAAPQLAGKSETTGRALGGNSIDAFRALTGSAAQLADKAGVAEAQVRGLIRSHGLQANHVLSLLPAEEPMGLTRIQAAVIAYAVRHEMAKRLADLLFVSTYWGHERQPTRENLTGPARAMGDLAGWDDDRVRQEIDLVCRIAAIPPH
jgi:glycerol-3-phosphate dehydrogenase